MAKNFNKFFTNEERTKLTPDYFNRQNVLKRLFQNYEKPLVIFDCGAYIGKTTCEFYDQWPDASIHCFEPNPTCIERLSAVANSLPANNLRIVEAAVLNEDGKAIIYQNETFPGLSGFIQLNADSRDSIDLATQRMGPKSLYKEEMGRVVEVEVEFMRLDGYRERQGLEEIHILKMDLQGSEALALEGLGSKLASTDVIVTEVMLYDLYKSKSSFFDIEKVLRSYSFELFDISHISKNPMNLRTDWVDCIYVNTARLEV